MLPRSLSRAFTHSREYAAQVNEYPGGETHRAVQGTSSVKSWQLTKRLTTAEMTALRTFYTARKGGTEAFYFYDPWDASFQYDASGAATQGRYKVVFLGDWSQTDSIGRSEVLIGLMEVA